MQAVAVADSWFNWRNRLLGSEGFRRLATRFPLTRWIARRRAAALFDLVAGFVYSQVLLACVRLHLFDILSEGPQTLDTLAHRLGLPPPAADRLLSAAVALRLVERRGAQRFGLGALGAPMVGNHAIAAMVEHHGALYADLADPIALLRGETGAAHLARYWPYAVDVEWSGISTGTERCSGAAACRPSPAWAIRWCPATSRSAACAQAGPASGTGSASACSCPARAASARCAACSAVRRPRLVVPARACAVDEELGERGVLLALAATAYHAVPAAGARDRAARPDRRPRRAGPPAGALTCWPAAAARGLGNEPRPRREGARATRAAPGRRRAARLPRHLRRQRRRRILDTLIARWRPAARSCWPASTPSRCRSRSRRPSCARRRSACRRMAAARPAGRQATLAESGAPVARRAHHPPRPGRHDADRAYRTAFGDPACLKMVLDWRHCHEPTPRRTDRPPRQPVPVHERSLRAEAAIEPDPVPTGAVTKTRRSSRSTARAASARASRWPT
jgi:hypothetical protein